MNAENPSPVLVAKDGTPPPLSAGQATARRSSVDADRRAGILAAGEGDGVTLRNCPPYIREWIDREEAQP